MREVKKMTLIKGDCLKVLREMTSDSIDSLVTDPPAGIGFMGKEWDHHKGGRDEWVAWMTEVMTECHRVLKPGAHGLVWALPRTSHWTAWALEEAGFEIRDSVHHIFGTGFPKSLNVSKAIDKAAGAEREVVGVDPQAARRNKRVSKFESTYGNIKDAESCPLTAPATPEAKQWDGWGTALKPAHEIWWLVRKPLGEKTVAKNVLKHGTGAINVDGCRVDLQKGEVTHGSGASQSKNPSTDFGDMKNKRVGVPNIQSTQGRFPSNQIVSGEARDVLDESARFFYCAKASKGERGEGNNHPTVKAQKLMTYLCRMVTPPGGTVLDPFMGSGSTGVAAKSEGFKFVGIEADAEYLEIAKARVK